jgi:hypothetical protein
MERGAYLFIEKTVESSQSGMQEPLLTPHSIRPANVLQPYSNRAGISWYAADKQSPSVLQSTCKISKSLDVLGRARISW